MKTFLKPLAIAATLIATLAPAQAGSLPPEMLGTWCRDTASDNVFVYAREANCDPSNRLVVRRNGFDLVESECRITRQEVEHRKPIDPSLRRRQFHVAYSFYARCGFGDADRPSNSRGMIGLRYEGELVLEWR
jgi:hypothetical protein